MYQINLLQRKDANVDFSFHFDICYLTLGRLQNGHKAMSVRDAEVLSFGTLKECGAKKQSVSGRYDNNSLLTVNALNPQSGTKLVDT